MNRKNPLHLILTFGYYDSSLRWFGDFEPFCESPGPAVLSFGCRPVQAYDPREGGRVCFAYPRCKREVDFFYSTSGHRFRSREHIVAL